MSSRKNSGEAGRGKKDLTIIKRFIKKKKIARIAQILFNLNFIHHTININIGMNERSNNNQKVSDKNMATLFDNYL